MQKREYQYQRLGNGFWLAAQAWPLSLPLQTQFPIFHKIEDSEEKTVLHKSKPEFDAGWVFTNINEQQGRVLYDPMLEKHYARALEISNDFFPGRDFISERGWLITDWDIRWFEQEADPSLHDEWGKFSYELRQLRFDFNSEFLAEVYRAHYLPA